MCAVSTVEPETAVGPRQKTQQPTPDRRAHSHTHRAMPLPMRGAMPMARGAVHSTRCEVPQRLAERMYARRPHAAEPQYADYDRDQSVGPVRLPKLSPPAAANGTSGQLYFQRPDMSLGAGQDERREIFESAQ